MDNQVLNLQGQSAPNNVDISVSLKKKSNPTVTYVCISQVSYICLKK